MQSLSDRIPDPDDVAGPAGKSLETLVASLDSDLLKPLGAALEAIQSAATLLPAAAPGAPLATEAGARWRRQLGRQRTGQPQPDPRRVPLAADRRESVGLPAQSVQGIPE